MNPEAHNLPFWMQVATFAASGILTLLTLLVIVTQLIKKPTLKFRLTREIFFRITDAFAEAIFANGVLVSENAGVFIEQIVFRLNKVNDPLKSFVLRTAYFGEKVRGLSPMSDFNWFSTSPLAYIPVIIPQRFSYLLVQEAYEEAMKKAFSDFRNKIVETLSAYKSMVLPTELEQKQKEIMLKDFYGKIDAIISEAVGKIMELVQIESGEYELEAEISYKIKRWLILKRLEKVRSKISFKIEPNIKDKLRVELSLTLQTMSANLISNENKPIKNPEYAPFHIREL